MLASALLTSLAVALTASFTYAAPAANPSVLVKRDLETDVAIQRAGKVYLVSGQNIVPDNCEQKAEETFANAQEISNPADILAGTAEFKFTSDGDGYTYTVKPSDKPDEMVVTWEGKPYGTCYKPTPVDCYSNEHPGWQLTKAWYCTYHY